MSNGTPSIVELADWISALLYALVGWISIGVGVMGGLTVVTHFLTNSVTTGTVLLTTLWLLVTAVLIALGVFVNPRFRRRLNRRHAPSTFGRVRTVDRRTIRSDEHCTERCVACDSRIDRGLIRRYREEYAIAGVPVYTSSIGYNHYCLECATVDGEVPDADSTTGGDAATERDESPADDRSLERR